MLVPFETRPRSRPSKPTSVSQSHDIGRHDLDPVGGPGLRHNALCDRRHRGKVYHRGSQVRIGLSSSDAKVARFPTDIQESPVGRKILPPSTALRLPVHERGKQVKLHARRHCKGWVCRTISADRRDLELGQRARSGWHRNELFGRPRDVGSAVVFPAPVSVPLIWGLVVAWLTAALEGRAQVRVGPPRLRRYTPRPGCLHSASYRGPGVRPVTECVRPDRRMNVRAPVFGASDLSCPRRFHRPKPSYSR